MHNTSLNPAPTITLSMLGGTDTDFTLLGAVLTLAGSALKTPWRLTGQEPADMALVVMDAGSGGAKWWRNGLDRYPAEQLIAYAADADAPSEARWRLPRRGEGSPPRLGELARLLNEITAWRQENSAPPPLARSVPAIPSAWAWFDTTSFVPEAHLLGLLQQAARTEQGYRIDLGESTPEVLVQPSSATFLSRSAIEGLLPLCLAERGHLRVRRVDEADGLAEPLSVPGYRRGTLLELIWFAALAGSRGRLLAGCAAEEPVVLCRWPDFSRLPYYAEYMEIAAYMSKRVASLTEVAAATDTPLGQVVDFHNACMALDLIARGDSAVRHIENKTRYRERLSDAFRALTRGGQWQRLVKVLITGSVGSGKTTAIAEASDLAPVFTEARPSDQVADRKATTTVAMDYGEVSLSCGVKVQLLGTPGQRRFEFMGQILCRNLWGLVILVDHSAPDPLDDLRYYLKLYGDFLPHLQLAVAVTHHEGDPAASLEPYRLLLEQHQALALLDFFDPRRVSDPFDLLTRMAQSAAAAPPYESPGLMRV